MILAVADFTRDFYGGQHEILLEQVPDIFGYLTYGKCFIHKRGFMLDLLAQIHANLAKTPFTKLPDES